MWEKNKAQIIHRSSIAQQGILPAAEHTHLHAPVLLFAGRSQETLNPPLARNSTSYILAGSQAWQEVVHQHTRSDEGSASPPSSCQQSISSAQLASQDQNSAEHDRSTSAGNATNRLHDAMVRHMTSVVCSSARL